MHVHTHTCCTVDVDHTRAWVMLVGEPGYRFGQLAPQIITAHCMFNSNVTVDISLVEVSLDVLPGCDAGKCHS
jgi:hypothetical protein